MDAHPLTVLDEFLFAKVTLSEWASRNETDR